MKIYASRTLRGFCESEIFGDPEILIPDPKWVRPAKSVILGAGESLEMPDGVVENETDEPMVVNGVPDIYAEHPLILTKNPDCRLPEDAEPISAEDRRALLSAPFGINWDVVPPQAASAPVVSPAAAWATKQAQAQALINATDAEFLQACESLILGGAPSQAETKLAQYRRALRAVVSAPSGNPSIPLPTRS